MKYENYKKTRDKVWELLLKHGYGALPIKVSEICRREGIPLLSYDRGISVISALGLEEHCKNDGFTVMATDKPIVFFNDRCSPQRQRFTIAHELGHLYLGHLSGGQYTTVNREPEPGDAPEEREANVFAARLLAPACVLWGLNVRRAADIARLCEISRQSASFRAERLALLYEREQRFLAAYGVSCFLLSPLERRVFEQFSAYIRKNRL